MKTTRRGLIKSGCIAGGIVALGFNSSAKTSDEDSSHKNTIESEDSRAIKATVEKPVSDSEIRSAQNSVIGGYTSVKNSDSLQSFAATTGGLNNPQLPVVGYGIKIQGGVPNEIIRRVPRKAVEGDKKYSTQNSSDPVSEAHDDIDQFIGSAQTSTSADEVSSFNSIDADASPSTDWTPIGNINQMTNVYGYDGLRGRIDSYVQVWSANNANDSRTQFACVLKGDMWPGSTLNDPDALDTKNHLSNLNQKWSDSLFDPNVHARSPMKDIQTTIDTGLSVGAQAGADSNTAGASVSVSREIPYIKQYTDHSPEEVYTYYEYPNRWWEPDAQKEYVQLKSLGIAWCDTPTNTESWKNLLTTDFRGIFHQSGNGERLETPVSIQNLESEQIHKIKLDRLFRK